MNQGVFSVCCATETFTEEEKGKRSEERIVAKTREIEEKTEEMWRDIAEIQRRVKIVNDDPLAFLRPKVYEDDWDGSDAPVSSFGSTSDISDVETTPPSFWELTKAHFKDNPLRWTYLKLKNKLSGSYEDPDFQITPDDVAGYEDFPQIMNAKNSIELLQYKRLADDIKLQRRVMAERGTGANIAATISTVSLLILAISLIILAISLILAITLNLKKIVKKLAPFVIVFLGLASFRSSFFTLDRSELETLFGTVNKSYDLVFYLLRVLLFFAVVYCFKKQKFRMYCVKHRFSMLATFAFCVPLFGISACCRR